MASKKRLKTINPDVAGQPWAMREDRLRALATAEARVPVDLTKALEPVAYETTAGVALLEIVGPVLKYADIWTVLFGGVSTIDATAGLAAAETDPAVQSILLYIDSPGGTVAGTADFANAIANCSKPVTAYVSDMACSAAYWLASQADEIVANSTASIGSIGVYTVVTDSSRLYEDAGVKVNLVKAGEFKGTGVDGVPITADQLDDVQREINGIYEIFVASVAAGRGMPVTRAKTLATGQTWIASEAKELGLVDRIEDLSTTLIGMTNKMADKKINKKESVAKTPKVEEQVEEVKAEVVAPVEAAVEVMPVEAVAAVIEPVAVEVVEAVASVSVAQQIATAVADTRAEAFAAGVKAEGERLAELVEMAGTHPAFVLAQFKAGATLPAAAKAFAHMVRTEAEQAKALDPSNGVGRLTLPAASGSVTGDPDSDWNNNIGGVQKKFASKSLYVTYEKNKHMLKNSGK